MKKSKRKVVKPGVTDEFVDDWTVLLLISVVALSEKAWGTAENKTAMARIFEKRDTQT